MAAIFLIAGLLAAAPSVRLTEANLGEQLADYRELVAKQLRAAKRGAVRADAPSNRCYNKRSGRFLFRSVQDRDAHVRYLESELERPTLPSLMTRPSPVVGQIGNLAQPGTTYEVIQVVGGTDAIVRAETDRPGTLNDPEWTFWIHGGIIGQFRDDRRYKSIPGTWQVTGRKSYTTVIGGSRTVDYVEAFDLSPYRPDQ